MEASGLTRRFGDVAAVSDVSFSVRRGDIEIELAASHPFQVSG